MSHHNNMEAMISSLSTHAENSGQPETVAISAGNLYEKALSSVRQSRMAHNRGDYQTAVSMMHHAGHQAIAAAKTHGAGSSVGSIHAIMSDYARNVGQ